MSTRNTDKTQDVSILGPGGWGLLWTDGWCSSGLENDSPTLQPRKVGGTKQSPSRKVSAS